MTKNVTAVHRLPVKALNVFFFGGGGRWGAGGGERNRVDMQLLKLQLQLR